ncbi:MAG TPA: metallophosphoesterase [Hanamia sp.]|nr:metallophosphoesterase [Hanamia sp.]
MKVSLVVLFLIIQYCNVFAQLPTVVGKDIHKLPKTNLVFNDDTSKLQFAIVSDLWGGNRPGVFEDAVSKIELLQPQFVMSVGDLTDGATYDSSVIDREWNDFNRMIKPLSMPFFYVAGNHDIGNPLMERLWQKRFGRSYYYFVYKNVLFLCVNTQDGGYSGIGNEQVSYFEKAIQDNPDVRWTFVFMHRPVWFTENKNQEGYEKIEAALKDHHYTLFSGHYHTYLNAVKNGNKHFVLGSTGGGSDLRGEKFGEFDHITWVTLNNGEGPKIINFKLDGLIKEDVVNGKTFPITNTLINEDWMITTPYVLPTQLVKTITSKIIFNNPAPYPLQVKGDLPEVAGYSIRPQKINLTIPANTRTEQSFEIASVSNVPIDIADLPFVDVSFNGSYQYDTIHYTLPAKKRLSFDWQRRLPELVSADKMAKRQFEIGDTSGFVSITDPEYLQNKWYWHGADDGLISFNLMHDSRYLYVVAFIKDDQLVLDKNSDQRDKIYLHFEDKNNVSAQFTILPDPSKSTITKTPSTAILNTENIRLNSAIKDDQIKIMLRLPLDKIMKPDRSIRFNIGYFDQDTIPEKQHSTLFWKPVWDAATNYINSGSYMLDFMN